MSFYEEIFKLKTILRKGWVVRGVSIDGRSESDAEHCFSMMMLALHIMEKEKLKLDELKVLKMIAYHELGEIDFGDHTPLDIEKRKVKYQEELKCVERLAKEFEMPEIKELWIEFEENRTPEAQFVKKLDRFDGLLQCKLYARACNRPEMIEEFTGNSKEAYEEFKKYFDNN